MTYFEKAKLERAVKDGRLEVLFGAVEHRRLVTVKSSITGKQTSGYVEQTCREAK